MKLDKVDHVGILVRDIDDALKLYTKVFGLRCALVEENKAYNVKIAFLPLGEVLVELVQPIGPGAHQKKLETAGEGFDHICFKVDDIEAALNELKREGVPLVNETPQAGGAGARVAFLRSSGTNNVSIELKEGGADIA